MQLNNETATVIGGVLFVALLFLILQRRSIVSDKKQKETLASTEQNAFGTYKKNFNNLENERAFLKKLSGNELQQGLQRGMHSHLVTAQFGRPDDVETRQLKTKRVEVYKYRKSGRGYALKVTLENNRVTSWEDRR